MGLTLVGTSSGSGSLPATGPVGTYDETSIALPSGVQAGDLVFVVCCGHRAASTTYYAQLKTDSRYVSRRSLTGTLTRVHFGAMQLGEDLSDIVVQLPRLGADTEYSVNTATWRCLLAAYRPSVELPALALSSPVDSVPAHSAYGLSLLEPVPTTGPVSGNGQRTLTPDLGVDSWMPTAWGRLLGLVYAICHVVLGVDKVGTDADASVDSVDESGLTAEIEGGAAARNENYAFGTWSSIESAIHLQILTEPFETPGAHDHAVSLTGTTQTDQAYLGMLASVFAVFKPAVGPPSAQRSIFGQLLVARIGGGNLVLDRYDDASPEAVEGSATIEAGASGVSLWAGRDGSLECAYVVDGDVKLRESRDQGRTWGVATTIASGYLNPVAGRDEPMGLHTVLMYKEADSTWYQSTKQTNGTWSSPVSTGLVGANCAASLLPPTKGTARWEFVYTNADGDVVRVECRNPSVAGTWTWE